MTDNIFGKNLADCRKSAGLSRKELAEKLGSNEMTIGNYERGEREPNFDKLILIADILKTSVEFLLTGKKAAAYPTDKNSFEVNKNTAIGDDMVNEARELAEILKEAKKDRNLYNLLSANLKGYIAGVKVGLKGVGGQ